METLPSKIVCASHLHDAMRDQKHTLRQANYRIRKAMRAGLEFDAITFSGMSGALIAPTLAMWLGKTMLVVRKPEDTTHSCYRVEGDRGADRYIVVDDFISTGQTLERIVCGIRLVNSYARCVGVYEYSRPERGVQTLGAIVDARPFDRLRRLAYPEELPLETETLTFKTDITLDRLKSGFIYPVILSGKDITT